MTAQGFFYCQPENLLEEQYHGTKALVRSLFFFVSALKGAVKTSKYLRTFLRSSQQGGRARGEGGDKQEAKVAEGEGKEEGGEEGEAEQVEGGEQQRCGKTSRWISGRGGWRRMCTLFQCSCS